MDVSKSRHFHQMMEEQGVMEDLQKERGSLRWRWGDARRKDLTDRGAATSHYHFSALLFTRQCLPCRYTRYCLHVPVTSYQLPATTGRSILVMLLTTQLINTWHTQALNLSLWMVVFTVRSRASTFTGDFLSFVDVETTTPQVRPVIRQIRKSEKNCVEDIKIKTDWQEIKYTIASAK